MISNLTEFEGKPLQSVAKGGLGSASSKMRPRRKKPNRRPMNTRICSIKIKAALGDKVKDVRVTHRLTDSPSCIVADEHDLGQSGTHPQGGGRQAPECKPILEINPGIRLYSV